MKEVARHLVLFSLLIIFGAQRTWTENSRQELYFSPNVQNYFYLLFYQSGFGYDLTECAAWITYENGSYSWRKWAPIKEKHKEVWNRPIPPGSVAIAHTHPANDIAQPSKNDISTAKKIRLPIYTISIEGIWKVTPDGTVYRIKGLNWRKEIKARCQKNGNRQLKCNGQLLEMDVL